MFQEEKNHRMKQNHIHTAIVCAQCIEESIEYLVDQQIHVHCAK